MNPIKLKIVIGLCVILLGAGAVLFPGNLRHPAHSAAWYISHPAAMKVDEARCGGDASKVSQATCQNVFSAEQNNLGSDLNALNGGK